jgi:hypothetical protein
MLKPSRACLMRRHFEGDDGHFAKQPIVLLTIMVMESKFEQHLSIIKIFLI